MSVEPIKRLCCTCCGAVMYGRQWHNQDVGYGLCNGCIERCKRGNDDESMQRTYGVLGHHYGVNISVAREATIYYDDGDYTVTRINGTDEEIADYYLGKVFTREDNDGTEHRRTAVRVVIEP
jgi:hypothetical protein